MKYLKYLLILFLFTGCGAVSRGCANVKGHDEVCVDGVIYLQFPSGVTPKLNREGKAVTCS